MVSPLEKILRDIEIHHFPLSSQTNEQDQHLIPKSYMTLDGSKIKIDNTFYLKAEQEKYKRTSTSYNIDTLIKIHTFFDESNPRLLYSTIEVPNQVLREITPTFTSEDFEEND